MSASELTSSMNMGILRAEDCEDIFWEEKKHWINAPGSGSSLLDIIPLNQREKETASSILFG